MLTCCGRLDGAPSNMYSNPVHVGRSLRMPRHATYTYVREHLARLLEQVEADRDVVIINRRGHEAVALVPAGGPGGPVGKRPLVASAPHAEWRLPPLRPAGPREGEGQQLKKTPPDSPPPLILSGLLCVS